MMHRIPSNPIIDRLPDYLRQYIKPQHYDHYSPRDQAVWRYVMRKNVMWLKEVAHESYMEGLRKTGISIDAIPSMYGMNRILKEIGWAAVAVDGFIPPAAFMAFQAYNVLVIASEIRPINYISYTPAPDIIHEAAGHAPIIANREYAEYLRRFGEIGSKAIASKRDWDIYETVRRISQLKEKANPDPTLLKEAEEKLDGLQKDEVALSEMAAIRNLHWWTVEYGLIGTPHHFRIYGAGLLSSIGESNYCLTDKVKKIPYTIEAAHQNFDITRPQPQLFVTPNFAHLSYVLEAFADTMSLRKGGLSGVQKLIESEQLGTIELSTGLQISGVFDRVIPNESGGVAFVQTSGPTALAFREKTLIGHDTDAYPSGFGTPLGKLKHINLPIENMSPRDLEAYNIYEGKTASLEFEGGIRLSGDVITGTRNIQGQILVISFKNCLVTYREEVLFHPEQGIFQLAVGQSVVAAFAGPADHHAFDLVSHELSTSDREEEPDFKFSNCLKLYENVRQIRTEELDSDLDLLVTEALKDYSEEWLLLLELYEQAHRLNRPDLTEKLKTRLNLLAEKDPEMAVLIHDGFQLV